MNKRNRRKLVTDDRYSLFLIPKIDIAHILFLFFLFCFQMIMTYSPTTQSYEKHCESAVIARQKFLKVFKQLTLRPMRRGTVLSLAKYITGCSSELAFFDFQFRNASNHS